MVIEKGSTSLKEKISNFITFNKVHYKKSIWIFIMASLTLSFFFYPQTEKVLKLGPIDTFTWIFLAVSVGTFIFRKKIEAFFYDNIYSDQKYIKDFYAKIDKMDDKEKGQAPSPNQPLKRMMFFLNGFLWLNVVLFLGGKVIGSYIGFNFITSPIAVACIFGQMYLAYKTIQLVSKNLILLFKLNSEKDLEKEVSQSDNKNQETPQEKE